jgi:hypothetical protein
VGQRFRSVGVVAVVVTLATVAGACAKGVDTAEVSADASDSGVTLPTSTTIARAGNGNTANASTGSSRSKSKSTQTDLSGTAQQLISKLASDPTLLSKLTGGDAAALSRLTGLDPTTLSKISAGGKLDPQVAATILSLAAQLDPAAAAAIKGVDPLAIASLISAATTVDPKVLGALGGVLQVVDPNGLGKLAGDKSSLAILAVLFGVALRTDPSKFAQLANANNLDPNVNFVLSSIGGLVSGFTPQLVNQLNGISRVLGPDLLRALGAILGLLGRPAVAAVVQKAAADPVVIVTILGTIGLLVPGLAEVIAPGAFTNPQARYGALAGLIAIAIANLNGLDLNALALQFGLPPLSGDFNR